MGILGLYQETIIICMDILISGRGMKEELYFWVFSMTFGLWVANSSFSKKEEHLFIFHSLEAKTEIDSFLLRNDRVLYKDCEVIPCENLLVQHKLLVMDLVVKKGINGVWRISLGLSGVS